MMLIRRLAVTVLQGILLVAVLALGLWLGPPLRDFYRTWFAPPPYVTGDHSALYRDSGAAVVMFSTSTCPYCRQARALLTQRGVAFREYLIDRSPDAERRFDGLQGRSVPLLFIGERRIVGYREDTIVEALNRLPAPTPLVAR